MSEEDKHKLSKILYYSDIHPADTEFINNIIYDLQQENKQLNSILTELERALKDHKEIKEKTNTKEYYIEVDEVLDTIQKLKEKYK